MNDHHIPPDTLIAALMLCCLLLFMAFVLIDLRLHSLAITAAALCAQTGCVPR